MLPVQSSHKEKHNALIVAVAHTHTIVLLIVFPNNGKAVGLSGQSRDIPTNQIRPGIILLTKLFSDTIAGMLFSQIKLEFTPVKFLFTYKISGQNLQQSSKTSIFKYE